MDSEKYKNTYDAGHDDHDPEYANKWRYDSSRISGMLYRAMKYHPLARNIIKRALKDNQADGVKALKALLTTHVSQTIPPLYMSTTRVPSMTRTTGPEGVRAPSTFASTVCARPSTSGSSAFKRFAVVTLSTQSNLQTSSQRVRTVDCSLRCGRGSWVEQCKRRHWHRVQ